MIYDFSNFFNELGLLEIRFNILDEYVDYFGEDDIIRLNDDYDRIN